MRAGAIEDYTYLWWDVRPHPNLGTVETRVFDQQTRVEHTVAPRRADRCRSPTGFASSTTTASRWSSTPSELIDDNKVRAARARDRGRADRLPRTASQVPAPEMAARPARRAASRAPRSSAAAAELEPVEDLLANGTGAHRQLASSTATARTCASWSADRRGAHRAADPRAARSYPRSVAQAPELSVVCKSCGSEVSPYVTECPYCGTRLRKRAPKLERDGDEIRVRESRRDAPPASAASGRRAPRGGRARRRARSPTVATIAASLGGDAADRRPRRPVSRSATSARSSARSATSAGATSPRRSSTTTSATCSPCGLAIAIFVPPIERRLGSLATATLIVACGALGSLAAGAVDSAGSATPSWSPAATGSRSACSAPG